MSNHHELPLHDNYTFNMKTRKSLKYKCIITNIFQEKKNRIQKSVTPTDDDNVVGIWMFLL